VVHNHEPLALSQRQTEGAHPRTTQVNPVAQPTVMHPVGAGNVQPDGAQKLPSQQLASPGLQLAGHDEPP